MPAPANPPSSIASIVASNVREVRGRIAAAERSSGRSEGSVRLVGVTKSVGPEVASVLLRTGVRDLGENRPERLLAMSSEPSLADALWHAIGTYQRRKVRDTLARVARVHSLHSVDLAEALSRRAIELGRVVPCLLQVNVSGEASKQGLAPEEAGSALAAMRGLAGIVVDGLMTMAPEGAPPGALRGIFAATRELRDRLTTEENPLTELSMGMSSDFEPAILEGATLVRIGSALFHGIPSEGTLT